MSDRALRLVQDVFPGSEPVDSPSGPADGDEGANTAEHPSGGVSEASGRRSGPVRVPQSTKDLIEATDAILSWFAANEPGRLDRPGFVRLVAANKAAKASTKRIEKTAGA